MSRALRAMLARLSPVDFVLVEGYKRDLHVKIEVHRVANGKPLLYPEDRDIKALASDGEPFPASCRTPTLTISRRSQISSSGSRRRSMKHWRDSIKTPEAEGPMANFVDYDLIG